MNKILEINAISKGYNGDFVVNDLSFALEKGQVGCLLGGSGCGKTTVLRCIAGFEQLQKGTITIAGNVVSTPKKSLPPENRKVGMVFQDYALFPHLTVESNIVFGLGHLSGKGKNMRVRKMLELVGLGPDAGKFPHELSGGQQQRVALARALAPEPELLLMDEPFSNLDVMLRERLSLEVGLIIRELGISALLVTHNQHEAFAMADQIGIMHQGALEQWDTAYNLYHKPGTRYVAGFIGEGALIQGVVIGKNKVKTGLGTLTGEVSGHWPTGTTGHILIRPEDIIHDDDSPYQAKIARKHFRGAQILYTLRTSAREEVLSLESSRHDHQLGQSIGIRPDLDKIILFN
jgi:iron(III) transport system ATP-binding protein